MRGWLAHVVMRATARVAARLPSPHRDWGEAVLAEWEALPADDRRLSWAVGAWWFVRGQRRAARVRAEPTGRLTSVMAILGVVTVAPFAYAFLLQSRDNAPDATVRSIVAMLVAESTVAVAFLASLRRWRFRAAVLVASIAALGGTAALAAADNGGWPALAAVVFTAAPAAAGAPIVVADLRAGRLRRASGATEPASRRS